MRLSYQAQMTDWDLLTPGIGLTTIGIVGVGLSLSGIANTFLDGMNAVTLLTMYIGLIFLTSGLFKDGFPTSGKAKSATFITLGFLVTFGVAAAVTVSVQVPSIYAYIGLMAMIGIPASVLTVAASRQSPYLKALAIIFISAAIVGGLTFYLFGLATPKIATPSAPAQNTSSTAKNSTSAQPAVKPSMVVEILPGASAQNNPAFKPADFKSGSGTFVWMNKDNVPHTITSSADNGKSFDSGIISAGKNFSLDASKLKPGQYGYYCTIHPYMKGSFTLSSSNSTGAAPSSANTTQVKNASLTYGQAGLQMVTVPTSLQPGNSTSFAAAAIDTIAFRP